jgi:Sec-independent protein secretion pathway component TatC
MPFRRHATLAFHYFYFAAAIISAMLTPPPPLFSMPSSTLFAIAFMLLC